MPGGIRTPDTRLRRPLLYPTELQAHRIFNGAGEGDRTLATGLEDQGSTTELHPQNGGGDWIRTNVGVNQQIYSLPPLTTRALLHNKYTSNIKF